MDFFLTLNTGYILSCNLTIVSVCLKIPVIVNNPFPWASSVLAKYIVSLIAPKLLKSPYIDNEQTIDFFFFNSWLVERLMYSLLVRADLGSDSIPREDSLFQS